MAALPYKKSKQTKKGQVEDMFNNISPRYDLLNHLLSANIDKLWRKKTIQKLALNRPSHILDVATGTGDFAVAATKIQNARIVGIDISAGMLQVAQGKIMKKGLDNRVEFLKADSEDLPFEKHTFDAAIVGFGVRNFENLEKGLSEIFRVLKPGSAFYVLEFSKPRKAPVKQLYTFYFKHILPLVGRLVSRDHRAYTYLPESVEEFPDGEDFLTILAETGFVRNKWVPLTFGIASIYEAHTPEN